MALKRKYSSYIGGARSGRMTRKYGRSVLKTMGLSSSSKRRRSAVLPSALASRVARIERTIETKEGFRSLTPGNNIPLPHNNIVSLNAALLSTAYGAQDDMGGNGQRVGDSILLKGLAIKLFLQNQANRGRVHYRIMVIKSAKGDTPTRATLFKGLTGNKIIDQLNTERYQVLAQKVINLSISNSHAFSTVSLAGVPQADNGGTVTGGIATKIVSMWVPGTRITRGGRVQYENMSAQPKFFDYHLIVFAYDWFGTPQDVNNVGAVSEGWIKQYYKDA